MLPEETLLSQMILNNERGPTLQTSNATDLTTASALTLTVAQIFGGQINRDPNGASRIDTLPTAALIAAYIRNLAGQRQVTAPTRPSFEFIIQNDADAAETITIAIGTGGVIATGHTVTIAQSNSKRFQIVMTTMTPGSEVYVLRNRGTFPT